MIEEEPRHALYKCLFIYEILTFISQILCTSETCEGHLSLRLKVKMESVANKYM